MCARHKPTDKADGASSVTTSPTTHRLATSIAAVTYGRPTGNRCRSSTTIRSTGVWSICTCSSSPSTTGPRPPAETSDRAASLPSRAVITLAGSNDRIRAASVFRDGTDNPRIRHRRTTSRYTAATDRR